MPTELYINTAQPDSTLALVASPSQPYTPVQLPDLGIFETHTLTLSLILANGDPDPRSGDPAYTPHLLLAPNETVPVAGKWILNTLGTTAELPYNASAQLLEDTLHATLGAGAATVTKPAPNTWRVRWNKPGAQTLLQAAAGDLTPICDAPVLRTVTGDASTAEEQVLSLRPRPLALTINPTATAGIWTLTLSTKTREFFNYLRSNTPATTLDIRYQFYLRETATAAQDLLATGASRALDNGIDPTFLTPLDLTPIKDIIARAEDAAAAAEAAAAQALVSELAARAALDAVNTATNSAAAALASEQAAAASSAAAQAAKIATETAKDDAEDASAAAQASEQAVTAAEAAVLAAEQAALASQNAAEAAKDQAAASATDAAASEQAALASKQTASGAAGAARSSAQAASTSQTAAETAKDDAEDAAAAAQASEQAVTAAEAAVLAAEQAALASQNAAEAAKDQAATAALTSQAASGQAALAADAASSSATDAQVSSQAAFDSAADAGTSATEAADALSDMLAAANNLEYQGNHDASGNTPPSAPATGHFWTISQSGTFGGITWQTGDAALYDAAGNWNKIPVQWLRNYDKSYINYPPPQLDKWLNNRNPEKFIFHWDRRSTKALQGVDSASATLGDLSTNDQAVELVDPANITASTGNEVVFSQGSNGSMHVGPSGMFNPGRDGASNVIICLWARRPVGSTSWNSSNVGGQHFMACNVTGLDGPFRLYHTTDHPFVGAFKFAGNRGDAYLELSANDMPAEGDLIQVAFRWFNSGINSFIEAFLNGARVTTGLTLTETSSSSLTGNRVTIPFVSALTNESALLKFGRNGGWPAANYGLNRAWIYQDTTQISSDALFNEFNDAALELVKSDYDTNYAQLL